MSTDNCTNFSPPWFTGRWRDWHRGHGCNLDDGQPRSAEGQAEIERGQARAAACDHPVVLDSSPPTCGVCKMDLVPPPDDITCMAARAGGERAHRPPGYIIRPTSTAWCFIDPTGHMYASATDAHGDGWSKEMATAQAWAHLDLGEKGGGG